MWAWDSPTLPRHGNQKQQQRQLSSGELVLKHFSFFVSFSSSSSSSSPTWKLCARKACYHRRQLCGLRYSDHQPSSHKISGREEEEAAGVLEDRQLSRSGGGAQKGPADFMNGKRLLLVPPSDPLIKLARQALRQTQEGI